MLVIFLILFQNVLVSCSDSSENKYVDLLPDKEKRQFMERVAKRILETIESKEHNPQKPIAIPDEQLGYQDFVSSILREEIDNDNKRRSKGEVPKENKADKAASQEKENLDVKPLESEKIADDPDMDQVDLTRHDQERRGGIDGAKVKSSDYINIEIDIDVTKKPITKRSVQNDTGIEDSVSDDISSESTENIELKTENSVPLDPKIQTSENLNSTQNPVENATAAFKLVESTTLGLKSIEYSMERLESQETKIETAALFNNNDSKIEFTTIESKKEEIDHVISKNNGSSESDGEDIQVRIIENLKTRKANFDSMSNESMENTTEGSTPHPPFEYFGPNLTDHKSNEYNSDTYSDTDVEEITTVAAPDNKTTESEPTTLNLDEFTEQSTPTVYHTASKEKSTESTLTSTMTDEETTYFKSTTNKLSSENPTTHVESERRTGPTRTTQKLKIVDEDFIPATTSRSSIIAILTTESSTKSNIPKINERAQEVQETKTFEVNEETATKKVKKVPTTTEVNTEATTTEVNTEATRTEVNTEATTTEVNTEATTTEVNTETTTTDVNTEAIRTEVDTEATTTEVNTEATTTEVNTEPPTIEVNTEPTTIEANTEPTTEASKEITTTEIIIDTTTKKKKLKLKRYMVNKTPFNPTKEIDVKNVDEKSSQNRPDKNFIELEKVYYNKKKDKKIKNEYQVFEIPANKSPFTEEAGAALEGPYFVPIYNYSSDNAYFNPTNRLGKNPDDDPRENIKHFGAFSIADQENDVLLQEILKDDIEAQNYDMQYTDTSFNSQRKKFGSNQKLSHSIHKTPMQDDSSDKKRGKVNPEDYLDSDYYFGKIRKDLRTFPKHDIFPNSNEVKHTSNLKDHVRAIRTMLFQQKLFGPIIGRTNPENELKPMKKVKKNIVSGNHIRSIDMNSNNIGIDYADFFGMKKMKTETTTQKDINNLKRVGYIKSRNATKDLYAIGKYFKENVVKYIHQLKSQDDSYFKADIPRGTPNPYTKFYKQKNIENDFGIQTFRDAEKKLNAELMKIPVETEKRKKVFSISESHKIDTVKNTISINDKKDIFLDIQQIQELKLKLFRRASDINVGVHLEVLKDMVSLDNKALKQYDWLGTTVDIRSSLQKLFELIALVKEEDVIHPGDMEILKYVIFLNKVATEIIEANEFGAQLRKKLALPRNKKKKQNKSRLLKEKGLLNRVWLYLRREVPEVNQNDGLENVNKFLMNLEDDLFDLHDAIKNIAKVTKYRNQHWYQNLKDLYLNADDKHLLELLLHMTVARLFGLIEESAKTGLEDDYVEYMKQNKKEAKRTLEELLFVMQIMDEIKEKVE